MNESLLDPNKDFTIDPEKDYFQELVGENKKYKDNAALARSRVEADRHINLIEQQNKEYRDDILKLREELRARENLQDLIDKLDQQRKTEGQTTPSSPTDVPSIKPEEIDTLLDRKITERESRRQQESNLKLVRDKLQERYGDRYQDVLNKQVSELGLSDVDSMARTQPKLLIKALGLDQQPQTEGFQSPSSTSQRFSPTTEPTRDWDWYEHLRKTDPTAYYSPKITRQMNEDYQRLGPKFETGNFKKFAPTYTVT